MLKKQRSMYYSTNLFLVPAAAAATESLQSCLTLCDPIDSSPLGSPIHGILQARTLEWVAISFSNAWKWKVKVKSLSHVWLSATPRTAAYQAPLSMGFSRQKYWSGVPLPSPFLVPTQIQILASVIGDRVVNSKQENKMSTKVVLYIPVCLRKCLISTHYMLTSVSFS